MGSTSDSKVIYYRDFAGKDALLSSKYEITEVDNIFWDVKAKRVGEGHQAWDLVQEFHLRMYDPGSARNFPQYHLDATRSLCAYLMVKHKADDKTIAALESMAEKDRQKWVDMNAADLYKNAAWGGPQGQGTYGTFVSSYHSFFLDGDEAVFRFFKDALVVME